MSLATVDKKECELAYSNPLCPYVTQININTNCMKNVEKALTALLGEDGTALNSGAIHDIKQQINQLSVCRQIERSWIDNWKPVIYSGTAACIGALLTYVLTVIH